MNAVSFSSIDYAKTPVLPMFRVIESAKLRRASDSLPSKCTRLIKFVSKEGLFIIFDISG